MRLTHFLIIVCFISILPLAGGQAQNPSVPQSNEQIRLSFAPVVKEVAPAVVNIYTRRVVERRLAHPFLDDPFFAPFFRHDLFGNRMRRQAESALGSGVIVDPQGLVVTNAHVISAAEEITVVLADGREFEATLSLSDEASDLALLRVEKPENEVLPYASLKPSEDLEVGDIVLAIGNPFGVGQTVTSGIVSAQGRAALNVNDFNFFIQTDAAINPGNSGGPLVTLDGRVVGINTAIYSRDGGSLGIGFAVPSEMVATVIAAEKGGQKGDRGVVRPWLGVTAQSVTADIAESLNLDKPWGALINDLHKASPLREAGVKVGDVLQSINGREVRSAAEMKFRMATVPLGETARIGVARNGRDLSFEVVALAPPNEPPREETLLQGDHPLNGTTVANLNPAVALELGLPGEDEGVVVMQIQRGSYAGRIVNPGDILLELGGREIEDVDDIKRALNQYESGRSSSFIMVLKRNGRKRQVIIR